MIAVIGASGFIGKNVQDILINEEHLNVSDFTMVYFNNDNIRDEFKGISFNEFISNKELHEKVSTIILVTGNSRRTNDLLNFCEYAKKDIWYLQQLGVFFSCNVIVLSSASVYDGLNGEVSENSLVMPNSLYGMSKLNSELMLKYLTRNIFKKKLVVYRLVYAYGDYERHTRFIPRIVQCCNNGKTINITGYKNYVDPISAKFVSSLLIKTALNINIFPEYEVINLAGFIRMNILDLAEYLNKLFHFNYKLVFQKSEINYYVSTEKLNKYLNLLNVKMEDNLSEIEKYYLSLLSK